MLPRPPVAPRVLSIASVEERTRSVKVRTVE